METVDHKARGTRVDDGLWYAVAPIPRVEERSGRAGAGPALLAAGLGALAVCLAAFASAEPPPTPPGDVVVWAADRDGSRVFGLDSELRVARRIPVDFPLDVEPSHDGGLWVLRAETALSTATHRLDRFDATGALVTELWIERVVDLDILAAGEKALIVELRAGSLPRLVRVSTEGSVFTLIERPQLRSVVGERASAIVGTSSGAVFRIHAVSGAVLAVVQVGGNIVDLAPGPAAGEVWALDDALGGRILLLDPSLAVRSSAPLVRTAAHLAGIRGEERAWVAGTTQPCVTRYGPGGTTELDRCDLPLGGFDRTLAWRDGVLVTAVGAILRLDREGKLRPGQGGFDFLVDLAPRSRSDG